MAPGSILNISNYTYITFSAFTFCSHKQKYQKYKLSSLSDLTFISDRKGIDNPLSRWLRSSYLFVQVRGTGAWSPTGLIPWFSKTKGNTYATLLHHPFLFKGNQRMLKRQQASPGPKTAYGCHPNSIVTLHDTEAPHTPYALPTR